MGTWESNVGRGEVCKLSRREFCRGRHAAASHRSDTNVVPTFDGYFDTGNTNTTTTLTTDPLGHCKKLFPEYTKASIELAKHDPPIK